MDNTYEQSTDSTFGNKPTMNVFIPTDEIINGDKVYRKKLKNGKYITSGFLWDIWTSIKKKYENKYEIIETFGYDKKAKYSTFISDTKKSKYDLVIAPFVHTANREKIINFSLPIYVDSLSISYSKKTTIFDDLPLPLRGMFSVGRLDKDSSGLLLLTNNGDLSRFLELPTLTLGLFFGNLDLRSDLRVLVGIPLEPKSTE